MIYKPRDLFPEKKSFSPDFLFQGDGVSFFYTYIRKNASTSFKKLFQLMHPGLCPGKEPSLACMAMHAQVKDLTPEEIDKTFEKKVFIYRDPVERVFSVYKNKLIQQDGAEDLLGRLKSATGRDPGLMTFGDFVNEYVSLLETDRWKEVDGHLYPQAWHLLPITYNMVIPMERVHENMLELLSKELCNQAFGKPSNSTNEGSISLKNCDADTPAIYFQRKYIQSKALPELEQVITPVINSRLKEIYAEDYCILEIGDASKEYTDSVEPSAQHKDNYSRLLVKIDSQTLEHGSVSQKLAEVKEQHKSISQELAEVKEQHKSVNQELAEVKEQHKSVIQQLAKVKEQHESVCQELVEVKEKLSAKEREAQEKLAALQEKLDTADAKQHEISTQYDEVCAKYRAANAKYRNVSQQLSALKSSPTYKAGFYVKAASSSLIDAVKLPVRLWRLKRPKKNQPKQRMNLHQGLRYVKWKVVVPVATQFGVPYGKIAYLRFPQSIRDLMGVVKQKNQIRSGDSEQPEAFTPPSSAAQEISILGWPDYPPNGKPYVIGIMAEFTTGCFYQEVNLIQPRPDNWYALAEKYQ
ncbi:MAG TPA: sulfotransferase family 2 domain-containing protein, partial [Halomonas sp.]|nr:sulfotransferase family 2 domain-containing protein [Halomonas sp.]